MKVYSIHLKPGALEPDRNALVIKEGFSWPAFLFGPFWALWNRLWVIFAILAGVYAAVTIAFALFPVNSAAEIAVTGAIAILIGLNANDWRRSSAARRGWRTEGLAAAPDRDTALRRYFDLHPDAAGPLPRPLA